MVLFFLPVCIHIVSVNRLFCFVFCCCVLKKVAEMGHCLYMCVCVTNWIFINGITMWWAWVMGVHCRLNDFSFEERENLYDNVHFCFSFLMSSQQSIPVHSGLCWKIGLYCVWVSVCVHSIACIDNTQQCLYCLNDFFYRFMANKGHKTPDTWRGVRCCSSDFT